VTSARPHSLPAARRGAARPLLLLVACGLTSALSGCAREAPTTGERIAATCEALGTWQTQSPEQRARVLTGVGGLEGEALARAEFLLTATQEAIEETVGLAELLAELTGDDSQRLLDSPACRAARAQLEGELCPLAILGAEEVIARQQLAELAVNMQERCLLEIDAEDALPLPLLDAASR